MSYAYKGANKRRNGSRKFNNNRRGQGQRRGNAQRGKYIDPAKFTHKASPAEAKSYEPTHAFSDFALHEALTRNLANKGFVQPTPIQDQAIPLGLEGKNIIGIANTGTGKTAAFSIPLLHRLLTDPHSKAIIIAPTRELAQQVQEEILAMAAGCNMHTALLIGGSSMPRQLRALKQGPRIIIGTPGRIKDHLNRKSLRLNHFDVAVLDEVDRMLDMGFVNDMRIILGELPISRQSFFFSATLDERVKSLIDTFSPDITTVEISTNTSSDNVHQSVVSFAHNSEKIDKLHNLLITDGVEKVLVFDDTKRNVDQLSKELVSRGFVADSIHGGKSQGQRQRSLRKFKSNDINLLVATDVAARGIDVDGISHVINYSIPQTYEDYIHRVGRAGRAGNVGHAFTFVKKQNR